MTTEPMIADRTASRRAIEALRSGVPNRDAVSQLGCNHPDIEQTFDELLAGVKASLAGSRQTPGLLVSGVFGSGKSHLLEYLAHKAHQMGFAVSKVTISKETPLSDPAKLFQAAAAELRVPGRVGAGLVNVAYALDPRSERFGRFFNWADPAQSNLPAQFASSLYVFRNGGDQEFNDRIVRFWSGDRLINAELTQKLRLLGQQATYRLQKLPPVRDLALQRFRFASRLIAAAGHQGWILLVDEVELVGQYSFKQRARAYAEVARWLGKLDDSKDGVFPGIGAVMAITDNFALEVISEGKNDLEMVGGRLRSSIREEDHLLATRAERGMRAITGNAVRLEPPSLEHVRQTHKRILEIYRRAFGCSSDWPPSLRAVAPHMEGTSVMRLFVRRWITEWDLLRLYPNDQPDVEVQPLEPATYREDPDLDPTDEPAQV